MNVNTTGIYNCRSSKQFGDRENNLLVLVIGDFQYAAYLYQVVMGAVKSCGGSFPADFKLLLFGFYVHRVTGQGILHQARAPIVNHLWAAIMHWAWAPIPANLRAPICATLSPIKNL